MAKEAQQAASYDPVEMLRETVKFFNWVLTAYSYDEGRIEALDDAMQDILHEIELDEANRAPEAAQLYREMRGIRKERRACKDEMEQIKPLVDWCLANRATIHKMEQIQGIITATRERQGNRQYRLRAPERRSTQGDAVVEETAAMPGA